MKKHATSHGLAVIVCTVTAGALVDMTMDYYPVVVEKGEMMIRSLSYKYGWNIPSRSLIVILVASILALFWGIAFSFMHSDEKN